MNDYINSKPLTLVFNYYDGDQRVDGFKVIYNSLSSDFIVSSRLSYEENTKKLLVSSVEGVILLFKNWWKKHDDPYNDVNILTGDGDNYCYCDIEYDVPIDNEGETNTYHLRLNEGKLKITEETINIFKDYLTIIQCSRSLDDEEKK